MPRLLDLYCGPGGASVGYARGGFEVIGVDLEPQPDYPFPFLQMEALDFLLRWGSTFDAIHASPPCQAFSLAAAGGARRLGSHVNLIPGTRLLLQRTGRPFIMENVPQAPLLDPVYLCGTQFDLPIIRHRAFECSFPVVELPWCGIAPTGRNRHAGYLAYPYARKKWRPAWREHVMPRVWPWIESCDVSGLAVPPAYTEFLGRQLLDHLASRA